MRVIAGRGHGVAAAVLAAAVLAAATATGCAAGEQDAAAPVTVTVTPPASAPPVAAASTVAAAPSPSAAPVSIPPMDRSFDAGLVAASRTEGATLVLSIDRLTVAGLDDAALAASGALIEPDPGDRFGNQRVALYDVAVAADALFVFTSCTRSADGQVDVQSQPSSAPDFVASVPADAPVIFTYTGGVVSRAEVNPRC